VCLAIKADFQRIPRRRSIPGLSANRNLSTWPNSGHLVQSGAMNYVTNTSTDSRLYGNLPKTQIDLIGQR
jgi:hypothetical protein